MLFRSNKDGKNIVGNFPCTGMHGGKMFLRGTCDNIKFPQQVTTHIASDDEKSEIKDLLKRFCDMYGLNFSDIYNEKFTVVLPDTKNPFKQMYVTN